MIRKTILGLVAAASLAAAFAPTTASAGYYGYGYRSHYSCYDCYKPSYSYGYGYKSYGYKSYGYGY
jgi:hypothetical protein